MSVLNRKELAESPLADLHQIASELGVESYRSMRKDDLIGAILAATGAADEGPPPAEEAEVAAEEEEQDTSEGTSEDTSEGTSEDTSEGTSEDEPDEVPAEEALERPARRGRRGGRGRKPSSDVVEELPEVVEDEISDEQISTGVLDILANGSGFVRVDPAGQSREDVYVSPAQIRRCEMRAGDEVSGPARAPRRNERHPSLVRIETVNGAPAEPVEERPWFGDLTPVFPSQKLKAPKSLKDAPIGRGSRVAIAGPPGAGATSLLRELAGELSGDSELGVQVVLAGVRPEEVTEWNRGDGLQVAGGSFDRSPDAQAQAAELAVERAKRRVERGGHAVVLIDSLEALPAGARRRIFGAGRATEEGGTLTVIATVGGEPEPLRWATTRVVLEPGGKVSSDSGTVRADALS
ncbi:MAG TPA: Rho termination factor N-terminal domain-containing protein [Thermoleophilaceae bacterium]|jgi:transcription termination factor Rho|nr:Rho termination factor N-terminal domain-containing protein [Thermoleophilaceae bacterium]